MISINGKARISKNNVEGLYPSSKFMTTKFYIPVTFKWTQNLHCCRKIPPEQQESVENGITPRSRTSGTISDCITEPQSRSAIRPQMARKCVLCTDARKSVSQVCLKWCAGCTQVYAGHATGANYRKCILYIAGVSQVYLKCTATCSQPSRRWISVHAIECTHDSQIWFRLTHCQWLFDGVSSE